MRILGRLIGVKNHLAVMFDLENEVIDHALGQVYLSVDEQTQGDEVGIPVVQLKTTLRER